MVCLQQERRLANLSRPAQQHRARRRWILHPLLHFAKRRPLPARQPALALPAPPRIELAQHAKQVVAAALTAWLQANNGILPRSLALDGKYVGDGKCGMIVTLCRHEDGRPVAMIPASGKKEDCEVSEARSLLADPLVRLENALVTADPLHNKEATLRLIVEKGGDYLVGAKANTSKRLEAAESRLKNTPFLP